MPANAPIATESPRQRLKLLVWPLLLALLFGFAAIGEPIEDTLRISRNGINQHSASGDIVLIAVDEKSLREIDNWPWPRAKQAAIITQLDWLGADKIVFDILYTGPSGRADDLALAEAIKRSGKVILAAQTRLGEQDGKENKGLPLAEFADHASVASIAWLYNWQGEVWRINYATAFEGRILPTLSRAIAGDQTELGAALGKADHAFRVDYSLDVGSIPVISAADLLNGRVDRRQIEGKTAVIGTTANQLGDQYSIPGRGKRSGVFIHIIGAETLKGGIPIDMGWWPAFAVALIASILCLLSRRKSLLAGGAAVLLLLPILLESLLIFVDVTAGLTLIAIVAGRLVWAKSKSRGLVHALTGLPNLVALAEDRRGRDLPLIAVRVHNYAEIASTLDLAGEKQFGEQLVARLGLGDRQRVIFQGDEGIFAWFADKGTPFANHLEALHALFRSPIRVTGINYDVALSFGIEIGSSRSVSSRLGSALVAADEADRENLKWKFHDPARLQEVPWRLSLLSQLDTAIDDGQVWIAYQPKLDLKTRRTVGAEALARWTHPEKGPISPTEFVTAAEQSDRIEKLTDFVLDQAIGAAAELARKGYDFGIAVNLSARMLNDRQLPERVAAVLGRHGLPADKLTLELTETAAISGSGNGIDLLARLRELGVRIAIDDYGTGLSTLDYLKKMPASEIKIDQSFIKTMRDNRSDLIMVQSTIALAHSLGRTVVAEGVEDPHSLEQLRTMDCDIAQGFIVGRPMSFDEMLRRLKGERKRSAA
ncbi:EAL domain-containing protein [Sphingomonas sp.]|uniref:putative bifunctional diguanylate cyclase/phosphodiesterase n=1 Tax=Sphingomonas sp. TaxID=28214 RepID=UPI00286A83BB|nr:EAL domain-containing protein [Sphingomonas sp.]